MKKFLFNVMTFVMVVVLSFGATACISTVVEDVDKNKVQLYIASYNGGGGYKWLDDPTNDLADDAESRFEKKYANTRFGDKVGVQVIVESSKAFSATKVKDSLATSSYDMYFAPASYYEHVAQGEFLDITDMVTSVSDIDNKSIESKMDASKQSLLKVNEKYYALPYYDVSQGITYDADLFNENKLYFSREMDTDGMRKFVTTKNATNLSCGPDAVYGTYDDGLPSTYQEFYKLMEQMVSGRSGETIIPFAFNGHGDAEYTNMLMSAFSANVMGIDAIKAHATFNTAGKTIEVVTGFENGQPKIDNVAITEENAYLLKSSLGMYYASELAQKIFSDARYYDAKSASTGSTNLVAMERYVKSGKDGSTPIAMLIEGSYWYNEAESEGVLQRARKLGELKNMKVMALPHQYAGTVQPKADGETPVSQVLTTGGTYGFIAADIASERIEAAKLFLQFCYSDEELVKAELSNNGIGRGLNYDTSSIQGQLSSYAKSVNLMKAQAVANGTICDLTSQHPIALRASGYFSRVQNGGYWSVVVNGAEYHTPCSAFRNGKAAAKDYFLALGISQNTWNNNYYISK